MSNIHCCQFCSPRLTLGYVKNYFPEPQVSFSHIITHTLYHKYAASQNYYYTKEINDIMCKSRTQTVILYQDYLTLDEEDEFLKRYYQINEYANKIELLTEFYKFHKDLPRWTLKRHILRILNYYYDKKRKIEFYKIQRQIEIENELNPQHPPKGIVGDRPVESESTPKSESSEPSHPVNVDNILKEISFSNKKITELSHISQCRDSQTSEIQQMINLLEEKRKTHPKKKQPDNHNKKSVPEIKQLEMKILRSLQEIEKLKTKKMESLDAKALHHLLSKPFVSQHTPRVPTSNNSNHAKSQNKLLYESTNQQFQNSPKVLTPRMAKQLRIMPQSQDNISSLFKKTLPSNNNRNSPKMKALDLKKLMLAKVEQSIKSERPKRNIPTLNLNLVCNNQSSFTPRNNSFNPGLSYAQLLTPKPNTARYKQNKLIHWQVKAIQAASREYSSNVHNK